MEEQEEEEGHTVLYPVVQQCGSWVVVAVQGQVEMPAAVVVGFWGQILCPA